MIHPCNNSSSSLLVSSIFGAASSLSTAAYAMAANTWQRSWEQITCKVTNETETDVQNSTNGSQKCYKKSTRNTFNSREKINTEASVKHD